MNATMSPSSQFWRHFREVAAICGASYLSHVNILVDQVFTGSLGRDFLNLHILVTSLGLIAFALGRALGSAVLVISGKDQNDHIFAAGIAAGAGLAFLYGGIAFVLRDVLLADNPLPPKIKDIYFFIFLLIAACDLVRSVASSAMVRLDMHPRFIRLSVMSIGVNIVLSSGASFLLEDTHATFISIGLATLIATVLPMLLSFYWLRNRLDLWRAVSKAQFARLWQTFRGEGLYFVSIGHIPIVTVAILQRFYGADLVNVYGVAQRVCGLLMAPWHISVTQTVKHVSGCFSIRSAWSDFLKAGEHVSWAFVGLPLFLTACVMMVLYQGAERVEVMLLAVLLPLRHLIQVMTHRDVVLARIHEVTYRVGYKEMLWSGAATFAALWAGAVFHAPLLGLASAFLGSGTALAVSLRYSSMRAGHS